MHIIGIPVVPGVGIALRLDQAVDLLPGTIYCCSGGCIHCLAAEITLILSAYRPLGRHRIIRSYPCIVASEIGGHAAIADPGLARVKYLIVKAVRSPVIGITCIREKG